MKAGFIYKRALVVLLCALLLTTCWVFTAQPTASATSGGTYYVKVTYNVSNTHSSGSNYIKVNYKDQNGATGSYNIGGSCATSEGDKQDTRGCTGVPYSIEYHNYGSSTDHSDWWITGVYVYSGSDYSTGGTTLWTGKFGCTNAHYNGSTISCTYSIESNSYGSWSGDGSSTKTTNSNGWKGNPAVTSLTGISGADSVAVNTNNTTKTASYTKGTIKDQYGVTWYTGSVSWGTASVSNGVTFSNGTLSVPASSNRSSNYTVTLNQSASVGNLSNSKSVTISTFDYKVTFYDENGSTVLKAEQTVDYNKSATAPSNPAPKYTTTQHRTFKQWDTGYTNITSGAQTIAVKAVYNTAVSHNYTYTSINSSNHTKACSVCAYSTTEAHSGWKYSDFGSDDYHKKTCGYCTYNETNTSQHSYGATEFEWDSDGKNITFTKTCQTTGCGHVWSQRVKATASVKTEATCTTVGTTTYTASSPFPGDNITETIDKDDIKALGHNWNTPTFAWSESVTPTSATATATRVCARCSASESLAATMSHSKTTGETCTANGVETWTATSPATWGDGTTDTRTATRPALGHSYTKQDKTIEGTLKSAADCEHDAVYYFVCSRCDDIGTDSWVDDGTATGHAYAPFVTEPTCTAQGYTTWVCANDNNHTYVDTYVDALGHDLSEPVVTQPTCTEDGSSVTTCSRCENSFYESIPALGHDVVKTAIAPHDGTSNVGFIYYGCSRCSDICWTEATYDETEEKWIADDSTKYESTVDSEGNKTTAEAVMADSGAVYDLPTVPAPSFNTFFDPSFDGPDGHDYSYRGASLKISAPYEYTDLNTTQGTRFTASSRVPTGLTDSDGKVKIVSLDSSEDGIIDFGYLYSIETYVPIGEGGDYTAYYSRLVVENVNTTDNPSRVYKTSIASQNAGKAPYDENGNWNWKGVSVHEDQYFNPITEEEVNATALTYNLVINIKAKNWETNYCARPYITYRYNGLVFTVYDEGEQPDSYYRNVADVAYAAYTSGIETEKVTNYCRDKILIPLHIIDE